jgi:hypothetical protein
MKLDRIIADLEAHPMCHRLGVFPEGEWRQVWGMYMRLALEPRGCFAWAGSSPQHARCGTHVKLETLRLRLAAKSRDETEKADAGWSRRCAVPLVERASWTYR